MKAFIYTILVALILAAAGFGIWKFIVKPVVMKIQDPAMMEQQNAPMPVTVEKPTTQKVTEYYEFTGTTQAFEAVDIRARVAGYLQDVKFKDGTDVSKNDILFQIEPDSFKAACDEASANVLSCKAELTRAELDLKRVTKAAQNNAVSEQDVSTKRADRDMAEASLKAAQASLTDAQLNLSYTQIKAPIDGRISKRMVDTGNLVGSGENTLLAQLLRIDPVYVYFDVSEDIIAQEILKGRFIELKKNPIKCFIAISGDNEYKLTAVIDYIDNKVDKSTGTIKLRAKLDNPEKTILPGMFVRVRVNSNVEDKAIMVQEKAIGSDLNSKYLLIVNEKNIVERRSVELGTLIDGKRVINNGISIDESYVLKGLHLARPGATVIPMPSEMAKQPEDTESQSKID